MQSAASLSLPVAGRVRAFPLEPVDRVLEAVVAPKNLAVDHEGRGAEHAERLGFLGVALVALLDPPGPVAVLIRRG